MQPGKQLAYYRRITFFFRLPQVDSSYFCNLIEIGISSWMVYILLYIKERSHYIIESKDSLCVCLKFHKIRQIFIKSTKPSCYSYGCRIGINVYSWVGRFSLPSSMSSQYLFIAPGLAGNSSLAILYLLPEFEPHSQCREYPLVPIIREFGLAFH